MNKVQNITDSELESLLTDSTKPVFIDFWAEWCGPCKMMEPIIDELSIDHDDAITFVKMNVDENPLSTAIYNIRSIPTFIVIKNNDLLFRHSGAVPKSFIDQKLSSISG